MTILVVGDVILDTYWSGEANRLSPEAPVPVVKVDFTEHRLGGAANVAVNISQLGGEVFLLGAVGNDAKAKLIERNLIEKGVKPLLLPVLPETIEKIRITSKNQQLIRADFEHENVVDFGVEITSQAENLLNKINLIILSDYRKGVLSDCESLIRLANNLNIPVLIDPKGDDYSIYRDAYLITPNKSELQRVVGRWKNEEEMLRKTEALRKELNLDKILLTRSEEGMTLVDSNGVQHFSALAKEVFDVSGAGDTVIATLGYMLTEGVSLPKATNIANKAAGIVVTKFGTSYVTRKELFQDDAS